VVDFKVGFAPLKEESDKTKMEMRSPCVLVCLAFEFANLSA